jgi:hypothetical protein
MSVEGATIAESDEVALLAPEVTDMRERYGEWESRNNNKLYETVLSNLQSLSRHAGTPVEDCGVGIEAA